MNWIEKQIRKIDGRVEENKIKIITSITYEDLTRNGSCTKNDFFEAQNVKNSSEIHQSTRNKMKNVISIAYDMVEDL